MADAPPAPRLEVLAADPQSEGLPVKRPAENGGGEELGGRSSKWHKVEAASGGGVKRVAEIVLALSTMATMRGCRKPTDVEIVLVREARMMLAELCQGLAPKDIVAMEDIGTVIEDLGLNGKMKDQSLGFRTPKMSIAERISHAKWKMEETKKYYAHSGTYTSQPLQTGIGGTIDSRVASHTARMFASDKSSHSAVSSAGTVASMPVVHVSAGSSAALQYQSTSNEVRPPVVSGVMPSSHLGRNSSSLALPKIEHPQFKVDGASNGSSYVLQVQANSSASQPLVNAQTWSIQTQSASLARSAPETKLPDHTFVKVEGTGDVTVSRAGSQIAKDQNFRPFITQTVPGNLSSMHQPLQGMNIVQAPLLTKNHTEIAKIVQKLLQPKLPEHPTWTPPSRDYMNKGLTCQMCELTVKEVDTVLLCDACEKGFHLKCLQPLVLRGIHNKVDWHCMRCLTLSGGKPLPPKYGRVMRSSNTPPQVPSNADVIQQTSEKKAGGLDPKVSPQKLTTNGSSVSIVATDNNTFEPLSNSKTPYTTEIQGTGTSSSIKHMDEKPDANFLMNPLSASSSPSVGLPGESSTQQINSEASTHKDTLESKSLPKLLVSVKCDNVQSSQNLQIEQTLSQDNAEVSYKHVDSNLMDNNQKESHGGENLTFDTKGDTDDQDVALANSGGSSGCNTEGREYSALSSDSLHTVEWIGDVIKLVDEKKFYQACCIDGVTYRLHDHALFASSHGKLVPSKLQSMWEDYKTGLKWVKVTKCYFPADLQGNIGHPYIYEVNEVYESNSDRTEMVGSIRGLCEVLPYDKFKQENDRQSQLGLETSDRLQPIFLCRWFYDEIKKLFQPVTS